MGLEVDSESACLKKTKFQVCLGAFGDKAWVAGRSPGTTSEDGSQLVRRRPGPGLHSVLPQTWALWCRSATEIATLGSISALHFCSEPQPGSVLCCIRRLRSMRNPCAGRSATATAEGGGKRIGEGESGGGPRQSREDYRRILLFFTLAFVYRKTDGVATCVHLCRF